MDAKKKALSDIEEAMKNRGSDKKDIPAGSVRDLLEAIYAEPDPKVRKRLMRDFKARHSDAADFIAANETLINAEAEAALIGAAVGGTVEEKEVSYKGGKRHESVRRKYIPPNAALLSKLLKSRMPDKYGDTPPAEIEVEDISDIEEVLYGDNKTENEE